MNPTHHPVVIIGAGVGGLTLARVLHVNGVESVVYERDAHRHARSQGGMLDIHEESGQAALRAAGLHDEFRERVMPGGEAMRVMDKHATVLFTEADEDSSGGRPEIDRGDLRELLLDSLPEGVVRWGAQITATRTRRDGRHEAALTDGSTVTADLLVGADGTWSTVRPLLSTVRPRYTGVSMIEGALLDADTRHPEAAAVVGGGMFFALGDGKGFLGHRDTRGNLHVHAAITVDESWVDGIDFSDAAAAKTAVLAEFPDWHPDLVALVAEADGPLAPRPLFALPVGHRWERVTGVTLLGDAAHVMSPFAGEGANNAMQDAAELAAALLAHPEDVAAALSSYEQAMFPRAALAAADSAAMLTTCLAPDAPRGLLAEFATHDGGGPAN